jgi:hypothetical protein
MSAADEANRMRWTFETGHYEVWYATIAHPATRSGFWIRYTLEAPRAGHGAPEARLWFARFDGERPERTFGFSRGFGIDQLRHEAAPFAVRIGASEMRHDGMKGALAGDGHEVAWELTWRGSDEPHLVYPSLAYQGRWAPTIFLVPNINVAAHGHITVDGERYELAGDPVGQSHVWGRKHGYSWAWSHCNAFEGDRGVALETVSARLRRGPVVLPTLTMIGMRLDGGDPDRIEIREPWQLPMARSEYGTGRYHLSATTSDLKVEIELTCRPEDMLLTEYVDPDGEPAYCHNTECADATVTLWRRSPFVGRWREARRLTSRRGAHFEWGARAGDPLVKKRHVKADQ